MSRRWGTFNEGVKGFNWWLEFFHAFYAKTDEKRERIVGYLAKFSAKHSVSSECNLLIAKWFLPATAYKLRLLQESPGQAVHEFRMRITPCISLFCRQRQLMNYRFRSIFDPLRYFVKLRILLADNLCSMSWKIFWILLSFILYLYDTV